MINKITAIVPIKAKSERVPGKNMRMFNGKPLMHYILSTLEEMPEIGMISVNTDSEAAAEYARNFSKVEVRDRPVDLCGNDVPMNQIIKYELSHLEGEHFLQTHATNPLLTEETIRKALEKYRQMRDHDALFSVTLHKGRFFDEKMHPLNHDPKVLLNTQDLAPLYEENSCLYLFSRQAFYAGGDNRLGTSPALFEMSRLEAQDIDIEEEFILAELLWRAVHEGLTS